MLKILREEYDAAIDVRDTGNNTPIHAICDSYNDRYGNWCVEVIKKISRIWCE